MVPSTRIQSCVLLLGVGLVAASQRVKFQLNYVKTFR